jgi:hypothetical protein
MSYYSSIRPVVEPEPGGTHHIPGIALEVRLADPENAASKVNQGGNKRCTFGAVQESSS